MELIQVWILLFKMFTQLQLYISAELVLPRLIMDTEFTQVVLGQLNFRALMHFMQFPILMDRR